ncbi:MAG: outer membrane protein assembly factor BamC, partial [Pseudomonadales bacterium]
MTEKICITKELRTPLAAMRLTSLFCCVLMLSSCGIFFGDEGVFRDRKNDYLQEKLLPPLAVPEEVNFESEDELFVIPTVTNESLPSDDFEVPRPAPLLNAGSDDSVRIQKLGDERWILIDLPPSHLWQRIKNFLAENKIPVVREEADQGLLETGWLKRLGDDAPKTKERYR